MLYHSFISYVQEFLLQQQKKQEKDGVDPQVGAEKDGSDKGGNMELQECSAIMSFTELLTAPSSGFNDEDMF
jgi:predicted alpha/beta-fold hydrolase